MDLEQYIKTELLVLIPVMYIIGMGLKRSKVKDKHIPLILGTISVILSALWVFATSDLESGKEILEAFFTAVTQGILTAGAGVYVNQLVIQAKKEE